MPQGLQIWDANGVLIIDTSKITLKQISINVVTDTTTAEQSISVPIPPNTTAVVSGVQTSGADTTLTTRYDTGTQTARYQWGGSGGGRTAAIRVMLV